jgi:hypothetical protein
VPQRTVSDVLARFSENGGTAETAKPDLPGLRPPEERGGDEGGADAGPAIQRDFSPLRTNPEIARGVSSLRWKLNPALHVAGSGDGKGAGAPKQDFGRK